SCGDSDCFTHNGCLERPRAQIDYFHKGGSRHIVYGLGDKGARLLQCELGVAFRGPPGREESFDWKSFLEHAPLVSEVMVAIELACRAHTEIRFIAKEELAVPSEINGPLRWKVKI